MAANNPLKDHSSVNQGRKRKRNGPQNPDSSLNTELDLNCTMPYSIVDGILALAIRQGPVGYQLQLVDRDKKYIKDTFSLASKVAVQDIIVFIGNKDFSGLIRYFKENCKSEGAENKIRTVDIIIWHIFQAAKGLILKSMSLPIVDNYVCLRLPSSNDGFITESAQMPISTPTLTVPPLSELMMIAEWGELERRELKAANRAFNGVQIIYSGASGSPVYRSPSPRVSAVKQDQPGNGSAPKSPETKRSSPIKR
jgi:hypothetical protein